MVQDPEVTVVGTFSGAMSVAKMGLMLCDMIDRGWIDVVITTGALVAHGFIENLGRAHYKYPPTAPTGNSITRATTASTIPWRWRPTWITPRRWCGRSWKSWTTSRFGPHRACAGSWDGTWRARPTAGTAAQRLFEGGAGFYPGLHRFGTGPGPGRLHGAPGHPKRARNYHTALSSLSVKFNPFLDLGSYAQKVLAAKKLGIFTVGGGVPRNWAQQVAPYLELLHGRLGLDIPEVKFQYGVRLCPEPAHWGGVERLPLPGGHLLGEIQGPGGRRPLRRGALRRHYLLAPHPESGAAAAGKKINNGVCEAPVRTPVPRV